MLTKTRSFWSYLFAVHTGRICPACEQPVLHPLEKDNFVTFKSLKYLKAEIFENLSSFTKINI